MNTNQKGMKNGKRFSLSLGVIVIMIALILIGCPKQNGPGKPVPKIGADLSLTGATPYWSQQIKRGMDLAFEHANAANPGSVPTIVYEDNQGDPKIAVTAFQKLVDADNVSVVVTAHTPIAKALRPSAGQSKVPLVGTVVSAVDFGLENEWSFLDWPSHEVLTPPIARYSFHTLGAKRGATFVVNDNYGTDGAKLFAEVFKKEGGQMVAEETMGPNDIDLKGQLTKIIAAKPDVLYMVARDAALANATQQARQAGYQGKIVGVNAYDAPVVWKTLGEIGNGIVYAGIQVETETPGAQKFVSDYQQKYSEAPDWVSLYGYSIGQYLIKLVQETNGDREKIRSALSTLKADTIRGQLSINESREIIQIPTLYIRENGKNVRIQEK